MKYTLANFWLVFGALCGFWCVYGTLITAWYSMLSDKAGWAQLQLLCALILFPLSIIILSIVFLIGRARMLCVTPQNSVIVSEENAANV